MLQSTMRIKLCWHYTIFPHHRMIDFMLLGQNYFNQSKALVQCHGKLALLGHPN